MGEFRRTFSKVWWHAKEEDEEEDDDSNNLSGYHVNFNDTGGGAGRYFRVRPRQRFWPSPIPEEESPSPSNRDSSSSPSNGSHKSQDSGFSDSESSESKAKKILLQGNETNKRVPPDGGVAVVTNPGIARDRRPIDSMDVFLRDNPYFPQDFRSPWKNGEKTCFIVDEIPKRDGGNAVGNVENDVGDVGGDVRDFGNDVKDVGNDVGDVGNDVENVGNNVGDVGNDVKDDAHNYHRIWDFAEGVPAVPCGSNCSSMCGSFSEDVRTSTPKKDSERSQIKRTAKCEDLREKKYEAPSNVWLKELRYSVDSECVTTLQSKSLKNVVAFRGNFSETNKKSPSFAHIALSLQQKHKLISKLFAKFYRLSCSYGISEDVTFLLEELTNNLLSFVVEYGKFLPLERKHKLISLMDSCNQSRQLNRCSAVDDRVVSNNVAALEAAFAQVLDELLHGQMKTFMKILENPEKDSVLFDALTAIVSLGTDMAAVREIAAESNGVQSLLTICITSKRADVRKASLRTLATVCNTAQSVRQFEKVGGVEIISDLLSDETKCEEELWEAVSVLVQITAPWVEDNHSVKGLADHSHSLVKALTNLIEKANSCERLLLVTAALANVTFMEAGAVWHLLTLKTAGVLLVAVRKLDVRASVFLQEQTATLIANMAAVAETRRHLAENYAVVALLCFLQMKHSPMQTRAEISACERLLHKSSIAISRLCSDAEVSRQVVELNGVARLVRLCRDERERNYNDGVLVACLAALRKITANCGKKVVEELNARELIEPRLVDSFLLYSSRQESYV